MSKYYLSNGEKMLKSAIDKKVADSKKQYTENLEDESFLRCEHCQRIDKGIYDVSHIISTKECQEMRKTEIAWDLKNLEFHLLDTGHFALEEKGDEIAELILNFLDKNNIK